MRLAPNGLLPVVSACLMVCGGVDACAATNDSANLVRVQEQGRVLREFSIEQLRGLPQVQVGTPQSRGAQVQQGPTVRSVLDAAGATSVTRLRVQGRDPAQTLTASEITTELILDITKRNTVKLTGTQLPRNRWVRDVTALVIDP
ncbi:hypothetical protein [Mycobacterium vicinigordonae]|uniref:Uncharacterized protein n=1 Tax=Mycobacterium vicinigordonae TaxID=1719132 RepID=A0A7D6I684_9MYCO|nr:hypothetical protein [Mycobacterium vicinigordonae]QLL07938.1 hypothetical protein H0P51_02790 [Mycobacterium vicinigordonae]